MSEMISAEWAHVLLTLIGMAMMGVAFVWAVKTDTKVLATKLVDVELRLSRIDSTIEKLNDQGARLLVFDERLLAQGQRLDAMMKDVRDLGRRVIELERAK